MIHKLKTNQAIFAYLILIFMAAVILTAIPLFFAESCCGGSGGSPAPDLTSVSPNCGSTSGGESVTLNGTSFSGTPVVKFGGTDATNEANQSATQSTATTPAHAAGAVDVYYENSDAQSDTLTNGFTYYADPDTPSISSPTEGATDVSINPDITGSAYSGTGSHTNTKWDILTLGWYDGAWSSREKLTIDNTQVGADLTNFPVYVDLSDMSASFFTTVKSNGADIRVTTSDGTTEVPIEVVAINTGSSTGELHFKAPSLSNSTDTVFYIYYGNPDASAYGATDTYGRNNVWSDYKAVYHFQADATDSTGNGNTGTVNGPALSSDSKLAGKAYTFTTNDYISLGSGFDVTDNHAMSAWFKTPDDAATGSILVKSTGAGYADSAWVLEVNNLGTACHYTINSAETAYSSTLCGGTQNQDDDTYHHLIATTDSSNAYIYVNGAAYQSGSRSDSVMPTGTASDATIGRYGDYDGVYWEGELDEIRVRNSTITQTWASTEYNNQNSPDSFYTVAADTTIVATRTAGSAETSTTVNAANFTFQNDLAGETFLDSNTTYYVRVRYFGCAWSDYSTAVSFTTGSCSDLDIADNLTLASDLTCSGTISVSNNTTLSVNSTTTPINITAANVTVDPGSAITATGYGYAGGDAITAGSGPGGGGAGNGESGGGGAYGGNGGDSSTGVTIGTFNGDAEDPISPGSGGGGSGSTGGDGGGAIVFNVSSGFTNNGTISSNGDAGTLGGGWGSGGGAGGAIKITTADLGGSGSYTANGGDGADTTNDGGGGSGGRIYISYSGTSTSTATFSATGGSGPGSATNGANGTIGIYDAGNNNLTIEDGWYWKSGNGPWTFDTLTINAASNIYFDADTTINATTTSSGGSQTWYGTASTYDLDYNADTLDIDNLTLTTVTDVNMTNFSTATTTLDTTVITTSGDITFNANGDLQLTGSTLTTGDQDSFTFNQSSENLEIDTSSSILAGNAAITVDHLTIDGTSQIISDGKGYAGGAAITAGSGPGGGGAGSGESGGGGAYGGNGGNSSTGVTIGTYNGDSENPNDYGSGGGGSGSTGGDGGGIIAITATGSITNNGTISSDGANGTLGGGWGSGGGAGGAIKITTADLSGSGTFSANGGDGGDTTNDGGGGSGGRIYVSFSGADSSTATFSATGGSGPGSATNGANGTIGIYDAGNNNLTTQDGWYWKSGNGPWTFNTLTFNGGVSNIYFDADTTINATTTSSNSADTWYGTAASYDLEYNADTLDLSSTTISTLTHATLRDFTSSALDFDTTTITASGNITLDVAGDTTLTGSTFTTGDRSVFTFSEGAHNLSLTSSSGILGGKASVTASNLTINSGTSINSDGKGYAGGAAITVGSGSGGGGAGSGESGGGGGYGGAGGDSSTGASGGSTYETSTTGDDYGSGGGGSGSTGGDGGGAIILDVTNTLTNNGTVSADGVNGTLGGGWGAGGGSGGSIRAITGTLSGSTGTFSANGGDGGDTTNDGGGGGGGRICYVATTNNYTGSFSVTGGSGPDTAVDGSDGTSTEDDNSDADDLNCNYSAYGGGGGGEDTYPVSASLTSVVFDTGVSTGAAYNSILWTGATNGGRVQFQIATSNSAGGPWTYRGGSDCGTSSWYNASGLSPNTAQEIGCYTYHNNKRYFRYKARLCSDDCSSAGTASPQVESVIISWSP